jgi:hypothetical protein
MKSHASQATIAGLLGERGSTWSIPVHVDELLPLVEAYAKTLTNHF